MSTQSTFGARNLDRNRNYLDGAGMENNFSVAIYRPSIGEVFFIRGNAKTSKLEMESLTDAREGHVASSGD